MIAMHTAVHPAAFVYISAAACLLGNNYGSTGVAAFVLSPAGLPGQYHAQSSRAATWLRAVIDPLGQEGNWAAYVDTETTGLVYYFNLKTGESLWEPPTATFPTIVLPEVEQEEEEKSSSPFGGMFSFLSSSDAVEENIPSVVEEVAVVEEVVTKDSKRGMFSFLSSDNNKDEAAVTEQNIVAVEEVAVVEEITKNDSQQKGFFSDMMSKISTPAAVAETPEPVLSSSSMSIAEIAEEAVKEKRIEEEEKQKKQEVKTADNTTNKNSPPALSIPKLNSFFKPKAGGGGGSKLDNIIPSEIPYAFESSTLVVPHPDKIAWGGEDAVFFQGRTFGVFDGVSGAEKLDGVPLYSLTLANQMKKGILSSSSDIDVNEGLTMKQMTNLLTDAAEYADEEATGASTAIVASLGTDNYLRVLNVGDCALAVVRDGAVVTRSKDIVHYFDCPYQLAYESPDRPRDGTKLNVEVRPGDVVLMASDGVFDNLSENELVRVLDDTRPKKPFALAKAVLDESRRVSLDDEAVTPYATQAKRNGSDDYSSGLGGKVDDISCVVLQIL